MVENLEDIKGTHSPEIGRQYARNRGSVNDKGTTNDLILNILKLSDRINKCEFLRIELKQEMLIYTSLSPHPWYLRWRSKKNKKLDDDLLAEITQTVQRLVPTYRIRVVARRYIFDLALEKLQEFKESLSV